MYAERLAAFAEFCRNFFYRNFYEGTRTYSLDPSRQFDIFDFRDFDLTIVGFCSCFNNDIFNKQGDIHPDCMRGAGMKLREPRYEKWLRIEGDYWNGNLTAVST